MATGMYVERVAELIEKFDPVNVPESTADIIELHNGSAVHRERLPAALLHG